jgi:hypothetical protein
MITPESRKIETMMSFGEMENFVSTVREQFPYAVVRDTTWDSDGRYTGPYPPIIRCLTIMLDHEDTGDGSMCIQTIHMQWPDTSGIIPLEKIRVRVRTRFLVLP